MNRINILSNRRALLTALLTILLAGAAPTLAQGPDIPGDEPERATLEADDDDLGFGPGAERRLDRLARRLELNVEQRDAIAAIHETGRARDLPLRKHMLQLRHDLQGEMMKDVPSEKTITALAREMGELRTKIQAGHLQDRLAVRKLLTTEQRDKLILMGESGRASGFRHGGQRGGQRWQDGNGPGCSGDGPRRAGHQGRNAD
jgi:Spy/CpxP family protein refolding chaperone